MASPAGSSPRTTLRAWFQRSPTGVASSLVKEQPLMNGTRGKGTATGKRGKGVEKNLRGSSHGK